MTIQNPNHHSAACAACKHQRRKCYPHCVLAPYFPAEKQQQFLNVHRLYGINNVVKLLKKIADKDRDNAMESVIYESNMWAINPVGGCCAVLRHLGEQIALCQSELKAVNNQIRLCKQRMCPNLDNH